MTTFSFANSILLNSAVAAALAILVWIVAKVPCVRRRPALRHCLWVIVLLKLVTPPVFEWSILPNWFSPEPLPVTHSRAIPLTELSSALIAESRTSVQSQSFAAFEPSIDWTFVVVLIAALGTLGVVGKAMAQVWHLRHALKHGAPNDERLSRIAIVAGKAMGVASPPPVCVVAANVSPLLWVRWTGPLIVVPRRLSDEMTDEQLSCVVSHEIAHFLRRDHWTNLLSLLVTAVCWWNPVVWWTRRELRIAQEACCDALVISRAVASRRKYAETLFQALEFLQAERSLLPALASGFGSKSSTERRFEMIANPLVNHRLSWWSYPVVLCALAVLPCLPSFTQAQDQESRSEVTDSDGVFFVDWDSPDSDGVFFVDWDSPDSDGVFFVDWDYPGQTDRRVYKAQRSKLGIVVLAFELKSGKLAWSSEIVLPADRSTVAGQPFLLHTGGGIVTIAVIQEDNGLKIRELDAETGKVSGEARLGQKPRDIEIGPKDGLGPSIDLTYGLPSQERSREYLREILEPHDSVLILGFGQDGVLTPGIGEESAGTVILKLQNDLILKRVGNDLILLKRVGNDLIRLKRVGNGLILDLDPKTDENGPQSRSNEGAATKDSYWLDLDYPGTPAASPAQNSGARTLQKTARFVGLSDIELFMFIEAMQGSGDK